MPDKWLKDYRLIDTENILHIPCNTRVPVGMFMWNHDTREFTDQHDDTLLAGYLVALGHELECPS